MKLIKIEDRFGDTAYINRTYIVAVFAMGAITRVSLVGGNKNWVDTETPLDTVLALVESDR